jgi:hypothetical protein
MVICIQKENYYFVPRTLGLDTGVINLGFIYKE